MVILQIEHSVPNYDHWKQAFDSDPVGREKSGVRRYRILTASDDPNYVIIQLEFDSVYEAETLLANLQGVWSRLQGRLIQAPHTRIAEVVEMVEY